MSSPSYLELMSTSYDDGDPNDDASERCIVFPNLLTPSQCQDAINMFETFDSQVGVVGKDYGARIVIDHGLRKCNVTYVPRTNENLWLHEICENTMLEANKVWRYNIVDFSQPMRMMDYKETDHFGSWHQDHGPGKTSYRKLSMIIQLDKPGVDYTGGEFEMMGGPIPDEYNRQGSAIVFPTYNYHRVSAINSGRRRTVVHRAIGPRFQ